MRTLLTFPFRLLFRVGETGIKILGFIIGFAFRSVGFFASRFSVFFFGALIGLFLGRKQIAKKLSEIKK